MPSRLHCRLRAALPLLATLLPLSAFPAGAVAQNATASGPESSTAGAQTASPPPTHSAAKTSNTRAGEIVTLDATGLTLTLKDHSGKTTEYALTARTRYLKNRALVQPEAFKPGDAAMIRLRKVRNQDTYAVFELTDAASGNWLREVRRATVKGTIKEMEDDRLTVVGADASLLSYVLTEKTRWSRGGREASAHDFKPGELVYIVPRSLSSGSILARAVADTPAGAAQMKERTATTVHGILKSVDTGARRFTLATAAGDTRTLLYTDSTELHQSGKTLPLTALKAGLSVGARLKRDVAGEEVASRITIEAPDSKNAKTHKKATVASSAKPTASK